MIGPGSDHRCDHHCALFEAARQRAPSFRMPPQLRRCASMNHGGRAAGPGGQAVTVTETGLAAMGILSDFGGRWWIVRQPEDGAIVVAKRRCSPLFETVRHRSIDGLTCRDERS